MNNYDGNDNNIDSDIDSNILIVIMIMITMTTTIITIILHVRCHVLGGFLKVNLRLPKQERIKCFGMETYIIVASYSSYFKVGQRNGMLTNLQHKVLK